MNGFIQFSLGGGNERRSSFGSQTSSAASDENSVVFTKKQQPEFESLRSAVESGITAIHAPTPAPTEQTTTDPLDRLKMLADLRDQGVLSEDEFAAQKRKILGS